MNAPCACSNDCLSSARRVAVMGGTFDPIHHAHLLIAEEIRRRFELPRVIFMPSGKPPHKTDAEITSAEDRYVMVQLATADNQHFYVSRMEIEREGPSYTIDTIRTLRSRMGEGAEVYFVTGADAILEILTWHEPDAIIEESRVVAVPRPGFDLRELKETLGPRRASKVTVIDAPPADISSTNIRERVAIGTSIRYLVPPPVIDYIRKRGLYRSDNGSGSRGPTC